VAQDTDYFVWIPARKPRRHGATHAAAHIGIACASAIGNVSLPGLVDAIDPRALGVTEPARIARSSLDPARFMTALLLSMPALAF
jgi:hypothetical protein